MALLVTSKEKHLACEKQNEKQTCTLIRVLANGCHKGMPEGENWSKNGKGRMQS